MDDFNKTYGYKASNENARELIKLRGELARLADRESIFETRVLAAEAKLELASAKLAFSDAQNFEERLSKTELKLQAATDKLNTADAWGRGVLYGTIAVATLLTQLDHILGWIKKGLS